MRQVRRGAMPEKETTRLDVIALARDRGSNIRTLDTDAGVDVATLQRPGIFKLQRRVGKRGAEHLKRQWVYLLGEGMECGPELSGQRECMPNLSDLDPPQDGFDSPSSDTLREG